MLKRQAIHREMQKKLELMPKESGFSIFTMFRYCNRSKGSSSHQEQHKDDRTSNYDDELQNQGINEDSGDHTIEEKHEKEIELDKLKMRKLCLKLKKLRF